MIITKDSHIDHGLVPRQLKHLLDMFKDRTEFFIQTVNLPPELGTVPIDLYGPVVGDDPIPDDQVVYKVREGREYRSRMLKNVPGVHLVPRHSRMVTVIAGPHETYRCVLYKAFGGPLAPKEPDDPTIKLEELAASQAFWAKHALATQ